MRILVIEDDAFLRKAYEVSLRNHGFEVSLASDGELGLHMAESIKPDAILLDLLLPVCNGVEVLRRTRSNAKIADIPVIVFSVACEAEDIGSIMELGATAYFSKLDTDLNELCQKIRTIVTTSS